MKYLVVNVSNIDWDVDEEGLDGEITVEEVLDILPKNTTVKVPLYNPEEFDPDDQFLDEAISNVLSDEYGWCVNGYNYTIKEIKGDD